MAEKMRQIRLKSKEERRFKQGHPWVYSNELQEVPKGMEPGELVSLHDAGGNFCAFGFGNPASLISFRELSRNPEEPGISSSGVESRFFLDRFRTAWNFRKSWFHNRQSMRLIYGEADGLSGLIIDRFCEPERTVYVVQPHSAGMDRCLSAIVEAIRSLSVTHGDPEQGWIILRRDASSREREGLTRDPVRVLRLRDGVEETDPASLGALKSFRFAVPGVMGSTLELSADLVSGQKTGFFFDQLQNIRLLETLLLRKWRLEAIGVRKETKILDLCSYVGQWGTHLLQVLAERRALPAVITCVDASEPALRFAEKNLKEAARQLGISDSIRVECIKADVLDPIHGLEEGGYDVVIADPPAFIKNRKSIPQGKQAYASLFQTAISRVRPGGLVACCSCSQLLSNEDFFEVLGKATRRSKRPVRWIAQGAPSIDHFSRLEFQEGHYLKCQIAQVGETFTG